MRTKLDDIIDNGGKVKYSLEGEYFFEGAFFQFINADYYAAGNIEKWCCYKKGQSLANGAKLTDDFIIGLKSDWLKKGIELHKGRLNLYEDRAGNRAYKITREV